MKLFTGLISLLFLLAMDNANSEEAPQVSPDALKKFRIAHGVKPDFPLGESLPHAHSTAHQQWP